MIYFLLAEDVHLVKIGTTANLVARLASYVTASPVPLVLLGTIPGGPRVEREWHGQYRPLRSHGEWFRYAPDLRLAIAKACTDNGSSVMSQSIYGRECGETLRRIRSERQVEWRAKEAVRRRERFASGLCRTCPAPAILRRDGRQGARCQMCNRRYAAYEVAARRLTG